MFNSTFISNLKANEEFDNLLKEIDEVDYTAFYRGYVVNNKDPEGLGRVRIRIPQIYGSDGSNSNHFVPSYAIPWAYPACMPLGNDSGSYLIPNVGDIVYVTFEGGNKNMPIYFGGVLTKRRADKFVGSNGINNNQVYKTHEQDKNTDIVHGTERVIYKSLKGATILVDDYDGNEYIKIIDQSGQSIIMENTGGKNLTRRGNKLGKNPESQIVITNNYGDSISIKKGRIHIKSENVFIETDNFKQIGISNSEDTTGYDNEKQVVEDILN